jgi:hypothetical protein
MRPAHLLSLAIVAIAAGVPACADRPVFTPGVSGAVGLRRLASLEQFRLAYEVNQPSCKLETAPDSSEAPEDGWKTADVHAMTARTYQVLARRYHADVETHDIDAVELLVDDGGRRLWLRNKPSPNEGVVATEWRCAVPYADVLANRPQLSAKYVQLDLSSPQCATLVPVIGTRDDLAFTPYAVTAFTLFAGAAPSDDEARAGKLGAIAVGARLEADGGERQLTIPATLLDRCFVPADRTPPPRDQAQALMGWLTSAAPDSVTPPPVSLATFEAMTGVDRTQCIKKGAVGAYECRAPILQFEAADDGPFGVKRIAFVRTRALDAVHFRNDKLVPAAEDVDVFARVTISGTPAGSTFGATLESTLAASEASQNATLRRGSHGFKLLTAAERSKATHEVGLDVSYSVPDVQSSVESRVQKYVAGKKQIHNPDYDKAKKELDDAQANSDAVAKEAKLEEDTAAAAAKAAQEACEKAGSQAGGFLGGMLAGAGCNAAVSGAGNAVANARRASAQERLDKANAALAQTPSDLWVDDVKEWNYDAKVLRRRGDAQARLTISALSGPASDPFTETVTVPFEAVDVEIPDDPAHGLQGKHAHPPSNDDVERTLAEQLIPLIDAAVIRWATQRQIGGDLGEMKPGTRPWMVAVARRAASDREIKLLSDLLENRPEQLVDKTMTYPVVMPAGSEDKCLTFTAVPLDGKADVNMVLGRTSTGGSIVPIAADTRTNADVGFEVCHLPAHDYVVTLSFGATGPSASGVLVAMFDSTPGVVTAADTKEAARGLPTVPRKGEKLELNGSGVVSYTGTGNQTVTGKVGDRDGDGIPDEKDGCPYDPETFNHYLDEDGCPDVAPAEAPK